MTRTPLGVSTRRVIYCVVPREMEAEWLAPLGARYRDNPDVCVIVDRRQGGANDRRRGRTATAAEHRITRDRRRRRAPGTFPRTEDF